MWCLFSSPKTALNLWIRNVCLWIRNLNKKLYRVSLDRKLYSVYAHAINALKGIQHYHNSLTLESSAMRYNDTFFFVLAIIPHRCRVCLFACLFSLGLIKGIFRGNINMSNVLNHSVHQSFLWLPKLSWPPTFLSTWPYNHINISRIFSVVGAIPIIFHTSTFVTWSRHVSPKYPAEQPHFHAVQCLFMFHTHPLTVTGQHSAPYGATGLTNIL